jgi:hypothetical protein
MSIDLAYTRRIVDNFSISLTGRYISYNLNSEGLTNPSAVAFDLGLFYKNSINSIAGASWAIGLQAANVGAAIEGENIHLPSRAKLGGSVNLPFTENHVLGIALDLGYQFQPSTANLFTASAGLEYTFLKHGVIRAGYQMGDKNKGYGSFATVGAGFIAGPVHVDFAYWLSSDEMLKNTMMLSLGVYLW